MGKKFFDPQNRLKIHFFIVLNKKTFFLKSRFFICFGLKTIIIEGITRFRWSDQIRCEKLHLLTYRTPPETSFESSYDPNIMLMDEDG